MLKEYPIKAAPVSGGLGSTRRRRAAGRSRLPPTEAAAEPQKEAEEAAKTSEESSTAPSGPVDEKKEFETFMSENITPTLKKCMDTQEYLLFVTSGIHEKYMSSRKRVEKAIQNNSLSIVERKRIQKTHTFTLSKLRAMKKNLLNMEKLIISSYKEGAVSLATLIYGKLTPDMLEYGINTRRQSTLFSSSRNNNLPSIASLLNSPSLTSSSSSTPSTPSSGTLSAPSSNAAGAAGGSNGPAQALQKPRKKEAFSGLLEVMDSNHKWKRRWVILKNNFVFIFKASSSNTSSASSSLSSAGGAAAVGAESGESIAKSLAKVYRIEKSSAEPVQPSEAGGREMCFRISGIPLVFCAPRAEAVNDWISAVKKTVPWFELGNKALSNTYNVRIFEISPTDLASRDPSVSDPFLPSFFCVLADSLMKWKLDTEGLFRISANPADVRALRSRFEETPRAVDVDLSGEDAHCITSLMKSWLRQLPPFVEPPEDKPILEFIGEHPDLTQGSVLLEFRRIIKKSFLPSNLAVLKKLCELMIKVAANEKTNKMSMNNLYVCLIPMLDINASILGYFIKHFRILFGDL